MIFQPAMLLYVAFTVLHLIGLVLARRGPMYQIDDNLMMIRCHMRHCRTPQDDCSFAKCLERSLNSSKMGQCPKTEPSVDSVQSLCLDTCSDRDFHCPGTQKCCMHECGFSCRHTVGLDTLSDRELPAVPEKVRAVPVELYRNSVEAEVSWSMAFGPNADLECLFAVEARSHPGYQFSEHKLGQWYKLDYESTAEQERRLPLSRGKTIEYNSLVRLRHGHWYQFRVASVNGNGTRGYSMPSLQFQLKERPRNPLPPRKFAINKKPRLLANQSVYAKVTWKPQRSDYPVEQYLLTYSLHLHSDNTSQNHQSLYLTEVYVPESVRFYEFWNLKPNSFYYLQLQAVCNFGRKVLKSSIETVTINTTILSTNRTVNLRKPPSRHSPELSVTFLTNKRCAFVVRIHWVEHFEGSLLELCSGGAECHRRPTTHGRRSRVRPHGQQFDFEDLGYSQRYSAKLIRNNGGPHRSREIVKSFTTPTLEKFNATLPDLSGYDECRLSKNHLVMVKRKVL